jgi:hypothetical protein
MVEHNPVGVVNDLGLVAELHRPAQPPLADRPGVRVVQADQPAGAVGHPAGKAGVGLVQHPAGPFDGGLQLLHDRPQPTGGLRPATGEGPAGAFNDPAGVSQLRLGQAGDLPGDLEHDLLGLVGARPHRPGDLVGTAAGRPPAVPDPRAGGPPAAWTRLTVVASLSTARVSSPRSVG